MNESANSGYSWTDRAWMQSRAGYSKLDRPISVYEVHLHSWMHVPEEYDRPLACEEIAPKLAEYVKRMNFTHVAIFSLDHPVQKHGGNLKRFIDYLHGQELGVILDSGAAMESPGDVFELYHADGLRTGDFILMAGNGKPFKLRTDRQWSHDVLYYFGQDPIYRKYHHDQITARSRYAFSDNFILPLSHDEVTFGNKSLLAKMPGDEWRKFANLRLLFACMYAQPGKKLLFMGGEFGQWREWNSYASLDWHLLDEGQFHRGTQQCVADLNSCYRREPAFHQSDCNSDGFEWADFSDRELSALSWLRRSARANEVILAVFNFTPVPRQNHRVGVPGGGVWKEIFNSDACEYGGSGQGNLGGVEASPLGWQSRSHSVTLTLPPLAAAFFKRES